MTGEFDILEVMGAGAALLDYDNDGDQDVLLIQGGAYRSPSTPADAIDRLFRNDLGSDGGPRFVDVTTESGIRRASHGMGVAAADYDGDGWIDLYITRFGANTLLHNQGDGTFSDTTTPSGTGDDRWSVSATFFDYDGDGWLDLFVGNYVSFDPEQPTPQCHDLAGGRDYCGPGSFPAQADRLYRNQGDGHFEDVTTQAGLAGVVSPALGVVAADLNGDGHIDLYVANDSKPNNLWINQGNGTFSDEALLAGAALNQDGRAEGSMGLAAEDIDDDGDLDLVATHLRSETNTLYRGGPGGTFDDDSMVSGLGPASRAFTAFGVGWLDFDNDGRLDLLVANGAVMRLLELAAKGESYPLHEPNQLLHSVDGGRFEDISAQAGAAFAVSEVSRGAAFGDIDNDGDTDVVITNNAGPARLLVNQVGQSATWLGLRLTSGTPPSDALGARAALLRRGAETARRRVATDGSYASAKDPRILFGLGHAELTEVEGVRIYWPNGGVEEWPQLSVNRYHTLRQGYGIPPSAVGVAEANRNTTP